VRRAHVVCVGVDATAAAGAAAGAALAPLVLLQFSSVGIPGAVQQWMAEGVVHVGGGWFLNWILLLLGGTVDRKVFRHRG
jgi:hypothetical protein